MADQATFEDDICPYRRPLYSTAVRLTTNTSDAEDLVQETLFRAYRSYGTFSPGTNLGAWLFRILNNAHINRYRARKRRPEETALDDLPDWSAQGQAAAEASASRSAEDEAIDSIAEADVVAAVDKLPKPYRQAVMLADVEGYSYREIAERLKVPIGTVMSRLHRGRQALRRQLTPAPGF
ncbi:MAG: sigma-70 family RNA polymerase sigma factor [Actinomycetota bacterium]